MFDALSSRFRKLAPAADYVGLRVVEEVSEQVSVRKDVPEPSPTVRDRGAMVTIVDGDAIGYAATSDLTDSGLRQALARAGQWAVLGKGRSALGEQRLRMPEPH